MIELHLDLFDEVTEGIAVDEDVVDLEAHGSNESIAVSGEAAESNVGAGVAAIGSAWVGEMAERYFGQGGEEHLVEVLAFTE